ncbi:MAG: hypothetical protein JST06_02270 [Bacteroidetes bacterium]|nr:hypothetical protein [Bacteroidota bacterium]MBS1629345.1 hypothetical protein [Bacteroidota bacterium]
MNESYVIPLFLGGTGLATLMLLFVMGVLFVQKNKQNNFKRRTLEARVEEQEKTVNEISRNLHDDVAQHLSLIQMKLNHMSRMSIDQIEDDVQKATKALTEVMIDVRHISHTLSSDWLRDRGLIGAITEDIEHINATDQIHCRILVEGNDYEMKDDVERAIFRITKEVINNMFKHSKASVFTIRMDYQPDLFTLHFTDNGRGFNPQVLNKDRGVGLLNLHSRAELLGGKLKIDSAPNKGCDIVLTLPVTEAIRGPIYTES